MGQAWRQTADGYQVKVDAANQRAGAAPLSLGCVPIIVDLLLEVAGGSVGSDGELVCAVAVPGAELGDVVLVNPTAGDTPSNAWYGLTPGPALVTSSGNVGFKLQNRTAGSISLTDDFTVRVCVLHILPEAP